MGTLQEPNSSIEQLVSGLEKVMLTDGGNLGSDLLGLPADKLRDLEKQAEKILATIRSAVNQTRPVNHLPPEIFIKVLEFRVKDRDLDAAVRVCARWRAILTSTSHLWTKVDFEYPARASLYLARSKEALVDVTVGKTRDTIIGPVGSFIGAIPWVSRMKSLCIQTDIEQIKKIAERLYHPTPHLESLTFEGKPRRYSYSSYGGGVVAGAIYVPREFLGREAPLLRSLTFRLVSPSVVFNFPLPNLTHIDWVAESAHVVIEELLDLFVSSPRIEFIKMHVLIRRTQMHEPLKGATLNHLRKLDWADCDGSLSLVPCLIAPQLSDLTIKVTHNRLHPLPTLSSILSPDGSRIPLLLDPTAVEYIYRDGLRSCRFAYSGTSTLTIREALKDSTREPISPWFPPDIPISFSGTRELSIEASGGCPPIGDVPIERFESLQRFELGGETESLAPMVPMIPSTDLSEIWITPRDHYFPLDDLAKVIKQRENAGLDGVTAVRIMGRHPYMRTSYMELKKVVKVIL